MGGFLLAVMGATQWASAAVSVSTNKNLYFPGETVFQEGAGWQQGETVMRVLHDGVHADRTLTSTADGSGEFLNSDFSATTGVTTYTVTATGQTSGQVAQTTFVVANVGGNLDQGKNETPAAPANPVIWVNGNLNDNQAHYVEGMSVPYRFIATGLAGGGESHTLKIGWDTRDGGKAALDYITFYQRLEPHNQFLPPHAAETVNPLLGLSGTFGAPTTFPIPAPSTTGTPVGGQPATSFNALPAGERVMTIYNGTITSMVYDSQQSLALDHAQTVMTITFTASSPTVVLAWGGHIASNVDWLGGAHPGGSPYHTRFEELDGSGGNQDRSLKAAAIFSCGITGPSPVCAGSVNTYTAATNQQNATFAWSFTSNGTGASFVGATNGSSVQVNSGSSTGNFTLRVSITTADGGVFCETIVGVNPSPVCSIDGSSLVCPGSTGNSHCGPAGMASYAWSITGSGTIVGASNAQCVSVTAGTGSCDAAYTLTLNITDANGCSSTCTKTVQVQDLAAPVIGTLPGPSKVECPATPQFATPTATDVCDATPTLTFADQTTPGTCTQEYSVTRTWTARDDCGNSSTASQTINVSDDTAPSISALPGPTKVECPASPVFTTPTATDVCDATPTLTFADQTTPGTCTQEYSVTRTWTARDACGNSSTASQRIDVSDDTAPVIDPLPGPTKVECPASPQFPPARANDVCDPNPALTFVDVTTPGSCLQEYSVTRTWTARDACGNSSTASQRIDVSDDTAPVIDPLPGPTKVECPASPQFPPARANDVCDPNPALTFVDVTTPGSCLQEYSVTRTWTARDACGNSSTASQRIDVSDDTAPVIDPLPGPTKVECPASPQFPPARANDVCDPNPALTFVDVTTPGSCLQEYSVTRTWTARDACGNSSTASQRIDVSDDTAPVIDPLPGPTKVECPASPQFPPARANDVCDPNPALTFVDVTTPGSCLQEYSVTRTWTARDACGNSSTASQRIDVSDDTAPVIDPLPGPTKVECPASPQFPPARANDVCDPNPALTFVDVTTPGSCLQEYSVTRTWTARDACGNSSTASQRIDVSDDTAPVIDPLPGPTKVECPASPQFPPARANDVCDPNPALTFVDVTTPGSCLQEYSVTRTWTARDACGNSSTASQRIDVSDDTAPVIDPLPGPTKVECPASPQFPPARANDVCDPNPALTFVDVTTPGSCLQEYSVTRTWTARDACGNSSTASQRIDVSDDTAPVIDPLPGPTKVECPASPQFPPARANDVCDPNPALTFVDVTTPGSCLQEYSVTRTWTARDACGNSSTASQRIDVSDDTAPVIDPLPGPTKVECPASPQFPPARANDVCDPNPALTFVDVTTPGSCLQEYSVTRTWTARDACGNSSTASQRIDVSDDTAPVISDVPGPSNIECPAVPKFAEPTANDACDPAPTLTHNDERTPGSCAGEFSVTRTWTATDACGNSSQKSQTITVEDNSPPAVVSCPGDITVGQCDNPPPFKVEFGDNCTDTAPTVVCVPDGSSPFPVGDTKVTCTATDACGNSNSCSFIVTVIASPTCSITGPTSFCQGGSAELCGPTGNFEYSWSTGETDRCITVNGAGKYTLTLTDVATGCKSTCSQDVAENPLPSCSIDGPSEACPGSPATLCGPTGNYTYDWSGPGGYSATTRCITVDAAGTYTLTVTDKTTLCVSAPCTKELTCTPVSLCRITGGGCLNEQGGRSGHKQNTFGGNVSPLHDGGGPSGNDWEHILRDGKTTLFNFHSFDAHIIACTIVPPGPCSPPAVNTRADFEGTGSYSLGTGSRTEPANFSAYIIDHGEGQCGAPDYYTITVRKGTVQGAGDVVFTIAGTIDCGNLQIHELQAGQTVQPPDPSLTSGDPSVSLLNRVVPNPFSSTMSYSYKVVDGSDLSVDVGLYDMAGRLVKKLASGAQSPGPHTVKWDGRNDGGSQMAPGMYFLRARVGGVLNTNRVIFLKK